MLAGEYPDVVIGCVGGDPTSRIAFPFCAKTCFQAGRRLLAVEPSATPSITKACLPLITATARQ
jgi:tryptophan synthase beta chain